MEEEEMDVIQHTWKKLEVVSKKTGMREGISDGRASNFQESFDIGYQEGFKNGFLLGKHKGILLATARQNSCVTTTHPLLEKISRGSCEICKNSISLEEIDVLSLIQLHSKSYSDNSETLDSHFKLFA